MRAAHVSDESEKSGAIASVRNNDSDEAEATNEKAVSAVVPDSVVVRTPTGDSNSAPAGEVIRSVTLDRQWKNME